MAEEAASFQLLESERLIVASFDDKIVLTRLAVQGGAVEQLSSWSTTQRVRSLALFQHQSSKKLLLAVGGDGKVVSCYDVSDFAFSSTSTSSAAAVPPPLVFSYGFHQKKISHVCAADDDIILADKFGEIYRVQLAYDDATATFSATKAEANLLDGDDDGEDDDDEEKAAAGGKAQPVSVAPSVTGAAAVSMFGKQSATFMLQHFSLLTQLYVTDCVPRRLLSCDREGHARVSQYPHTFVIDQFLWNEAPQAPVTCIAELTDTQCEGNVIVTGDAKGRVTFWCDAAPAGSAALLGDESDKKSPAAATAARTFKRLTTIDLSAFHAESVAHQSASSSSSSTGLDASTFLATTGVVGLTLLHNKAADAFGLLMALDKVDDLFFCPLRDGGFSIEVCRDGMTRVPVSRPVVGLASAGPGSALVVLRQGSASVEHTIAVLERDGLDDSSRVRLVDVPNSSLASELHSFGLESVDMFAYWRPTAAKDPRTKKQQEEAAAEGEEDEGEAAKKRTRTQ